MTTAQVLLTAKGLEKIQDTQLNGWFINLIEFGLSENTGSYVDTRDINQLETMWTRLPIQGSQNINDNTIQLICNIPTEVEDLEGEEITEDKNISELYLFSETKQFNFTVDLDNNEIVLEDSYLYEKLENGDTIRFYTSGTLPLGTEANLQEGKDFYVIKSETENALKIAISRQNALDEIAIELLSEGTGIHKTCEYFLLVLAQFTPEPLIYQVGTETILNPQLQINNFNTTEGIKVYYTQANEISSHNLNAEAHPLFQQELEFNGIFVNNTNFTYKGQNVIKNPIFASGVVDENIVYKKASDGKYYRALATSGEQTKWIGIKIGNSVRTGGLLKVENSGVNASAINTEIYLSNTVAGAFTTTPTDIKIGIHLGDGIIKLSSESSSGAITLLDDLEDVDNISPQEFDILINDGTNYVNRRLGLNDIGDVDTLTTAPINGDVLKWATDKWIPYALGINDLADVIITSASTNDYLKYNGTNWINSPLAFTVKKTGGTPTYNNINILEFSSNFSVTNTGTTAIIDYTGGSVGAVAIVGLNDVEGDFNIATVDEEFNCGLVMFDNRDANTDPEKVRFISRNTNDQLLIDSSRFTSTLIESGVLALATYHSLVSLAVDSQELDDYSNYSLIGEMTTGGTNFQFSWEKSNILMQGASITNATSEQKVSKLIFGTTLSGTFNTSTGELTLNVASGSAGIPGIESITSTSLSMVYDAGTTSTTAKVRGIKAGQNIKLKMKNDLTGDVLSIADCTYFEVVAEIGIDNLSYNGGIIPVGGSTLSSPDLQVYGIRGTNGVSVAYETSGSSRNILISGTGGNGFLTAVNTSHFTMSGTTLNLRENITHTRTTTTGGSSNMWLRTSLTRTNTSGSAIHISGASSGQGFDQAININDCQRHGLLINNTVGFHARFSPLTTIDNSTPGEGTICYFDNNMASSLSPAGTKGLYVNIGSNAWQKLHDSSLITYYS